MILKAKIDFPGLMIYKDKEYIAKRQSAYFDGTDCIEIINGIGAKILCTTDGVSEYFTKLED